MTYDGLTFKGFDGSTSDLTFNHNVPCFELSREEWRKKVEERIRTSPFYFFVIEPLKPIVEAVTNLGFKFSDSQVTISAQALTSIGNCGWENDFGLIVQHRSGALFQYGSSDDAKSNLELPNALKDLGKRTFITRTLQWHVDELLKIVSSSTPGFDKYKCMAYLVNENGIYEARDKFVPIMPNGAENESKLDEICDCHYLFGILFKEGDNPANWNIEPL